MMLFFIDPLIYREIIGVIYRAHSRSLMTCVTAGYLTTIARQGTKILTVFDRLFGHEYVVLYYGTSSYVVADPWVGKSYACLWDDSSFPANHVTVYTLMEIEETLSVPYGVDFPAQEIRTARRIGDIVLINNPPENQKLLDPDKHSLDKKKNAKEKYKSVVESEDSIGR